MRFRAVIAWLQLSTIGLLRITLLTDFELMVLILDFVVSRLMAMESYANLLITPAR
jgi:hypothetical protein